MKTPIEIRINDTAKHILQNLLPIEAKLFRKYLKILGIKSIKEYLEKCWFVKKGNKIIPIKGIGESKFIKLILGGNYLSIPEDRRKEYEQVHERVTFILFSYLMGKTRIVDDEVIEALTKKFKVLEIEYSPYPEMSETAKQITGTFLELAKLHKVKDKKSYVENLNSKKWLIWKGSSHKRLKLSKKINALGYTEKPTDFEKVFTEEKPTAWLADPEILAYLLYVLHEKDKKNMLIKSNTGRGVFATATAYFSNYCNQKPNYSYLSYKVRSGDKKYLHLRESVEKLVSEII